MLSKEEVWMSGVEGATRPATIGRQDGVRVAVVTLISAVSGYVILTLAARLLPVEQNTVFVTFWSTLFACFGVLSGLSIETTRAVATTADVAPDRRNPRVAVVGAALGGGAGLLLAATSPWWTSALFPPGHEALGLLIAGGVVTWSMHSVVVGSLAGRRAWRSYAYLIGSDALVRLTLVVVVAVVGAAVLGFAAAAVAATVTWAVFLLLSRPAREAASSRADTGWRTYLRRVGAAALAAGSSALLVTGFPVLLAVTTADSVYKTAAPLLLAIALTRAPLMIPLNAYQGVAVSHFVAHRDRGLAAAAPVLRFVGLLGLAVTTGVFLLGPWVLRVLLGPGYDLSRGVLAALTAASVFLAVLTLTGALCQALTMHAAFLGGWIVAVVSAFLLLLLPLSIEARCVVALMGGPAIGIAVHVVALRRRVGRRVAA